MALRADQVECTRCNAIILRTDDVCFNCGAENAPVVTPLPTAVPTPRAVVATPVQAPPAPAPQPVALVSKRKKFDRVFMALGTLPLVQFVSIAISVAIFVVLGNEDNHWFGFGIEALGVVAGTVLTAVTIARTFIKGIKNLGWIVTVAVVAFFIAVGIVLLAGSAEGSSTFAGFAILAVLNFVGWQITSFIIAIRRFK